MRIEPERLRALDRFEAAAAHEPGRRADATLFLPRLAEPARPGAGIGALAWTDPAAPGALPLAPLTRDTVLPMACRLLAE